MDFFRRIFWTKEKRLSKVDYWKKWELFELFEDPHEAEQLLNSRKPNGERDEFGVVLDKTVDNTLVGLIRWDSEKENDVEDWRGLFGSFLQSGGQVVDQGHEFKFIDDKGQLKKFSR